MKLVKAIALAALVSACGSGGGGGSDEASEENGDDNGDEQETVSHAQLVATSADLPDCDADSEGLLVYVKADKNFQVCGSSKWATIDLKGEDGKDGKDGSDAAYKIVEKYSCYGNLPSTTYWVSYSAAVMSNGDVFVAGTASGTDYEASATEFYSVGQVGAQKGGLLVSFYDAAADDSGYWSFELDRDALEFTAEYNNVGDVADGTVHTLATADCSMTEH